MMPIARLSALWSGLTGNLGRCSFCMRTSFGAAVLSWLALGAVLYFAPQGIALAPAAIAAALFTVLWIAHLTAYAARATVRASKAFDEGRRRSLIVFARSFAMAAVATALTASMARAACKSCTHTYSCLDSDGNVPCCPEENPYLCTTDCKCYADTANCNSYYKCTGS